MAKQGITVKAGGLGLGNVIAAVVSYGVNKSILWALVHGFFGWFYIIYYLLFVR